jgi:hypothetical protein
LSKDYFAGEKAFERIMIRPAAFWAERSVDMLLGARVDAVDPAAHKVTLSDGAVISYGSMIWATGGSPRQLPVEGGNLPGMHVVRTRADVDGMFGGLDDVADVAIVGGGYIGLEAAAVLKAAPAEVVERLKALVEERKALQTEVANLRRDLAMGGKSGGPEAKEINGVKLIAQVMTGVSGKDLPSLIDEMKARIGSGAVVLIADTGAKPAVAAGVTADLTDRISAVTLAKAAVEALGGKGGGGRPDMAQGGGADIALADAALKAVEAALEA